MGPDGPGSSPQLFPTEGDPRGMSRGRSLAESIVNRSLSWRLFLHTLIAATGVPAALHAQCGLQWQPGQLPGADAKVNESVAWDPDGPGPATPVVVFGGAFRAIGSLPASGVASYDPQTQQWSALGVGVDGEVHDLVVMPNGELVVGGTFSSAGGVPAACIAAWNGTAWRALGPGLSGGSPGVRALAVAPNGSLVVGGTFTQAGGAPAAKLARWDGLAWSPIGGGITGTVEALAHLQDGSLVVGGTFSLAGNVAVNQIARWDGAAWSSLGGGVELFLSQANVNSLLVLPNGLLVAAGVFSHAGTTPVGNIAAWDGSTWATMAYGLIGPVLDLELDASGAPLATSSISSGSSVMRWDGVGWTSLGPLGNQRLSCVTALANGDLVVGGEFTSFGTSPARVSAFGLARWDGAAWATMVPGAIPFLQAPTHLVPLPSGDLSAMRGLQPGGVIGPVEVAQWDGTSWQSLQAGLPSFFLRPCLVALTNGDLALSGGLISGTRILRWSGAAWAPIPGSSSGSPTAMTATASGGLVVATTAGVLRWDGASWTPLTSGSVGTVSRLMELPNGDIVAAGTFTSFGGVPAANIARFDGSQWHALGAGVNGPVVDLAALPNGDLVVCGTFTSAGGVPVSDVARWDGSAWSAFGSGMSPTWLASLQNGEVLAVGTATINGVPAAGRLARGDGTNWTLVDGLNGPATFVTVGPSGVAHVAGTFTNAGGRGSAYIASLASNCPARAVSYGTGCAGSAGVLALAPTTLPWIGGRSDSLVTGLAANAAVFGCVGLAAVATPLSTFHPAAGAGCTVLTTPLAAFWLSPLAGAATMGFGIPNDPSLVATVLREQILQAEFGAGGGIALLSSSNGLELTVGAQ